MADEMQEIEARLAAYVDGTLPADQRAEIEAYLKANDSHGRLIAELKSIKAAVTTLPKEKAPAEVLDGLQAHLERHQLLEGVEETVGSSRIQRWPQLGALAAVLMLAAGLGILVYVVLPQRKGPPPELAMLPDVLSSQPTGSDEIPPGGASLNESMARDGKQSDAVRDERTLGLSARSVPSQQQQYQQGYSNGTQVDPQVSNAWPPPAESAIKIGVPPAGSSPLPSPASPAALATAQVPAAQSALTGPTRVLTVTTDDPILTANLIASYFSQVNLSFQRVGSVDSVLPTVRAKADFGLADSTTANQPVATTAPDTALRSVESAGAMVAPATQPSEVVVLRELSPRQLADAETAVRAQRFSRQRTEANWVGTLAKLKDASSTQPANDEPAKQLAGQVSPGTQPTAGVPTGGFGGGGAERQASTQPTPVETAPVETADAEATKPEAAKVDVTRKDADLSTVAASNLVIVVIPGIPDPIATTQPAATPQVSPAVVEPATQSAPLASPATRPTTQP